MRIATIRNEKRGVIQDENILRKIEATEWTAADEAIGGKADIQDYGEKKNYLVGDKGWHQSRGSTKKEGDMGKVAEAAAANRGKSEVQIHKVKYEISNSEKQFIKPKRWKPCLMGTSDNLDYRKGSKLGEAAEYFQQNTVSGASRDVQIQEENNMLFENSTESDYSISNSMSKDNNNLIQHIDRQLDNLIREMKRDNDERTAGMKMIKQMLAALIQNMNSTNNDNSISTDNNNMVQHNFIMEDIEEDREGDVVALEDSNNYNMLQIIVYDDVKDVDNSISTDNNNMVQHKNIMEDIKEDREGDVVALEDSNNDNMLQIIVYDDVKELVVFDDDMIMYDCCCVIIYDDMCVLKESFSKERELLLRTLLGNYFCKSPPLIDDLGYCFGEDFIG
jgi:hypothetical protein